MAVVIHLQQDPGQAATKRALVRATMAFAGIFSAIGAVSGCGGGDDDCAATRSCALTTNDAGSPPPPDGAAGADQQGADQQADVVPGCTPEAGPDLPDENFEDTDIDLEKVEDIVLRVRHQARPIRTTAAQVSFACLGTIGAGR